MSNTIKVTVLPPARQNIEFQYANKTQSIEIKNNSTIVKQNQNLDLFNAAKVPDEVDGGTF